MCHYLVILGPAVDAQTILQQSIPEVTVTLLSESTKNA